MKLGYNTKAKDPTYYVQMGIRNGNKTTTKNIEKIGKHSELLKITDDPLSYAKEYVLQYNEKVNKTEKAELEIRLDFTERVKQSNKIASESTLKNVGYLYLQQLYNCLGIDKFFEEIAKERKISFNPDLVNRFLTYSRILDPDSKLGTYEKLDNFYEEPNFNYQHILRTMDILYENFDEYISYLFKQSNKIHKRNTAVCYYDCTNYYCEAETIDPEYVDEVTGEVMRGLRQFGLSKDHKPNPLVQMGLFMDTDGIPISMCLASGNTNEQTTAIPLEKELLKMFDDKHKKFIYCADAGLSSYHIRNFNSMGGRAFVVTQSVKKLSGKLKEQVFDEYGYRRLSDDKPFSISKMKEFDREEKNNRSLYDDRLYKVIEANTLLDIGLYEEKMLQNGKTKKVKSKGFLKQYVIITFSRKSMEYQRLIRNRQIQRAKAILDKMTPQDYKKGPHDVTRFIKKVGGDKTTYEIDNDKIREEEKYDGFYAIATNLDDEVKDIIAINEQRYMVENCFRILKTDFRSRPYFHRNRSRIIAHFMICYTALLIYRLLETKLNSFSKEIHLTTRNIVETIKNMNVANISDMAYVSQYIGSKALTVLEGVFMLGLDHKNFLPKDLNKKCRKKN